jgi:hypothetical protein
MGRRHGWRRCFLGVDASAALFRSRHGLRGCLALGPCRRFLNHVPDWHGTLLHRDGNDFVGARRISRGRLRSKWIGVQRAEVLFRDSAHGFLAWALASVLGAILLAAPASSLVGGTLSGATQAAANSAQSSPMDGYVDALLRPDHPSSQGPQNLPDARAEIVRLFTTSFKDGNELGAADRAYVAKVVSARTGLSQQDAEKRVNDVVTQIKADMDKARKAAMQIAIWLTLSLFIGAFCAALAATEGGGLRDGTWSKHPFRPVSINR